MKNKTHQLVILKRKEIIFVPYVINKKVRLEHIQLNVKKTTIYQI